MKKVIERSLSLILFIVSVVLWIVAILLMLKE